MLTHHSEYLMCVRRMDSIPHIQTIAFSIGVADLLGHRDRPCGFHVRPFRGLFLHGHFRVRHGCCYCCCCCCIRNHPFGNLRFGRHGRRCCVRRAIGRPCVPRRNPRDVRWLPPH